MTELREEYFRKIKVLNEQIWENRATAPAINNWLNNFSGMQAAANEEQLQALFLLSHFMYFGARETRELLRCLFRDSYKYPIISEIRKQAGDTTDAAFIKKTFDTELSGTRFLGVGNPAESGTHLLYYFRQENELPKHLFINSHEIFHYDSRGLSLRDPTISRYVFIDDLAGSGVQASLYSKNIVEVIKKLKPDIKVTYHVMFATTDALFVIRGNTLFDSVTAVFDLDPTFQCFGADSRYFTASVQFDKATVKALAQFYGSLLWSAHPLGYKLGQLLLGFHHNTPDNTLPIFWSEGSSHPWTAIFKRYPKIEW